ncbi:MAG: IS66 family transposase [Saccharofermentanales bacterium]
MKNEQKTDKNITDLNELSKEELIEKIPNLSDKNIELENQINWMNEQLILSKRKIFGPSSEKTNNPEQISLFNEAEAESDPKSPEPKIEEITYRRRKKKGKREADLSTLQLEVVQYELPEEDRLCPKCNESLHQMSKEIRTELVYIPATFKKIQHETFIYSCRNCQKNEETTPIVKAKAPKALIKGSIASASVVSGIINGKYVNYMPLYRQEKEFKRYGIFISRQNMANWIIRCATDYFDPLYELMRTELLTRDILHADDTTCQVLKEPDRKPTTKSYMWLYRTKPEYKPVVLFEYQMTREAIHPKKFLNGYKGYLQVDGYASYHSLSDDIIIVGCFAHSRRKFEEALQVIPEEARAGSKSIEGLAYCNRLFEIEREIGDYSDDQKVLTRKEKSMPVMQQFHEWLVLTKKQVLPKTKIGQAVHYAIEQWQYLEAYLLDPRLEISNNLAERSIRPFCVGRKNHLFSDTQNGAHASAVIYSLVETTKENNLKPYEYFKYLLTNMPNSDFRENPDRIQDFLPWSDKIPETCVIPKAE